MQTQNSQINFDYINYLHELYDRSDKVVPEFLVEYGTANGVVTYDTISESVLGIQPYPAYLWQYGEKLADDILETLSETVLMSTKGYQVYVRQRKGYKILAHTTDWIDVYFKVYNDVLMLTCHIASYLCNMWAVEKQYTNDGYLVQFYNDPNRQDILLKTLKYELGANDNGCR